jgi:hypothetical protein
MDERDPQSAVSSHATSSQRVASASAVLLMSTTSATFCPLCANLLLLEEKSTGLRFCCATCPFVYDIDKGVRAAGAPSPGRGLARASRRVSADGA